MALEAMKERLEKKKKKDDSKSIFDIVGSKLREVEEKTPIVEKIAEEKPKKKEPEKKSASVSLSKEKKEQIRDKVKAKFAAPKREEIKAGKAPSFADTGKEIEDILTVPRKPTLKAEAPAPVSQDPVLSVIKSKSQEIPEQAGAGLPISIPKPKLEIPTPAPAAVPQEEEGGIPWGAIMPAIVGLLGGGVEGLAATAPIGVAHLEREEAKKAEAAKLARADKKAAEKVQRDIALKKYELEAADYRDMVKAKMAMDRDMAKAKTRKQEVEAKYTYDQSLEAIKQRGRERIEGMKTQRSFDIESLKQTGMTQRDLAKTKADLAKKEADLELKYKQLDDQSRNKMIDREERSRLESEKNRVRMEIAQMQDRRANLRMKSGTKPMSSATKAVIEERAGRAAEMIAKDFNKTYIPLETARSAIRSGNYQEVKTLLSQLAKLGGDTGNIAVAEQDQQLKRTLMSDISDLKAYFGRFKDGKIPQEQRQLLLDKLDRINDVKNRVLGLRYKALKNRYSKGTAAQTEAADIVEQFREDVSPQKKDVDFMKPASDMSDEELDNFLMEHY